MEAREIKNWFEHYHELEDYYAVSRILPPGVGRRSISSLDGAVKKVILDQALEWMPARCADCARARWITFDSEHVMQRYKISPATFYRWTGDAINWVIRFIDAKKDEYVQKSC